MRNTTKTTAKPATKVTSNEVEKIGDLFDEWGDITARLYTHSECPAKVVNAIGEMLSDIDCAAHHPEQQRFRRATEARVILPFTLQVLRAEAKAK